MKKLLPLFVILAINANLYSQVSVYDCDAIDPLVTPQDFQNTAPEFYQQCILFGPPHNYSFSGTSSKTIKAATEIHLKEGFHAGAHTGNGQTHLQIMPKADFEVVSLSYTDLNNVLRYKKFEIGIELPTDIDEQVNNFVTEASTGLKINPFLEWELDVELKFTHQQTGTEKSIDCFYYREYERSANDWIDAPNEYVIRGRFAPPLNGKWDAYAIIKVNGVQVAQSSPFVFNVVESGDKGFVKVHENNRNLIHGDRMIFPVGHCLIGPYVDVDVWTQDASQVDKTAKVDDWMLYLNDISDYGDQGGKFIEVGQYAFSGDVEFVELGNYYNRLHYAWEYDHVLDICEEKDILLEFNLYWHQSIMKEADNGMTAWDFYTQPNFVNYCYNNENILGSNPEPIDMFLNTTMMDYHKQRNRYYISRYGYSSKIFEFQLLSEPWHLNQIDGVEVTEPIYNDEDIQDALENYHTEIARYIKEDLGHTEHLIGVDINMGTWNNFSNPGYIDQSIYSPNVDVVDINLYDMQPGKQIKGKTSGSNHVVVANENSVYSQMAYVHLNAMKPVFLAESGHGASLENGGNSCAGYSGHYVDVMSQGFNGCAGFMMWDGQAYPPFGVEDQRVLTWSSTIRAQQHFNADDFINTLSNGNGVWTQGRQTAKLVLPYTVVNEELENVPAVEMQYYISDNKEKAVGYVRNRSYNIHTKRTSEECSLEGDDPDNLFSNKEPIDDLTNLKWNDFIPSRRLRLEGLKKNRDYRIEWYSFKAGNYLETQCVNTQSSNLVLHYPELVVENDDATDNPVLWFVIYQYDCQQGMIVNEGLEQNLEQDFIDNDNMEIFHPATNVYPNPFTDFIIIETEKDDILLLETFDGQVFLEKDLVRGENKIELKTLAPGIYFVKFVNQGIVKKLIKL